MKKISLLVVLVLVISCATPTKVKNGKVEKNNNTTIGSNLPKKKQLKEITDGILVGKALKTDLLQKPFKEWFDSGYTTYQPDPEIIEQIKQFPIDYTITVFMGTWCEDSQNQVPKFYKILNEINFPLKKITLITMSREKTTPELFENNINITNVPTFLFFKKEKEMNRIVESPIKNLEVDLLTIISNKEYKHTYAQ